MSARTIAAHELEAPIHDVRLTRLGKYDVRDALYTRIAASAHERGLAQGARLAAQTLDAVAQRCAQIERELAANCAHDAAEIALEIARVLLRRELANGNLDLEAIVRETLAAGTTERSRCVVHLHPEDHARLTDTPFRAGTDLQADVGVARGDVHVQTPMGLLVREMDVLVEAIGEKLREELG